MTTTVSLTAQEQQMLHHIRERVDELARLIQQANEAGFTVNFNLNTVLGCADRFDVYKMMPVDMKAGAN